MRAFFLFLGLIFGFVGFSGAISAETLSPAISGYTPLPSSTSHLYSYSWYARVRYNAPVYNRPSLKIDPVRTYDPGFVYVTILREFQNEGETWYEINPNEFVHANYITPISPSKFSGILLNQTPTQATASPFGWIVSDIIKPSPAPDETPNSDAPLFRRYQFITIQNTAQDENGWLWYEIADNQWIQQTHVSLVDATRRPKEIPPNSLWVEVDLYEQTIAAYEGNQLVYATLMSSGQESNPTQEGIYQIWSRWEADTMDGLEGKPTYYDLEDVPYPMYFDGSIGFHGAYWHDNFGFPQSHGCINLAPYDAEYLFNWSKRSIAVGNLNSDDLDNALYVWVHTSDPHNPLPPPTKASLPSTTIQIQ